MARVDCLWSNVAVIFVNHLAINDSALCIWHDVDNCSSFQLPYYISDDAILHERLDFSVYFLYSSGKLLFFY